MENISPGQFSLIYNAFSFGIATFAAATIFLWLGRSQVAPEYKTALSVAGLVTFIAAYHYWRIFDSWDATFEVANGTIELTGEAYNRAYRYVDWLLTVPLLVIELILVMRLSQSETIKRCATLGGAAALMIILGYPGEITETPNLTKFLWGAASMVPFLYIVYALYAGLSDAISRQPDSAKNLVKLARNLTVVVWFFYPIVYFLPFIIPMDSGAATVVVELGYTIADVLAKAAFGLLIFFIALRKSKDEVPSKTPVA